MFKSRDANRIGAGTLGTKKPPLVRRTMNVKRSLPSPSPTRGTTELAYRARPPFAALVGTSEKTHPGGSQRRRRQ